MHDQETRYNNFNIFVYLWYWLISRSPVFILNFGLIVGLFIGLTFAFAINGTTSEDSDYQPAEITEIMPDILPQYSPMPLYSTPQMASSTASEQASATDESEQSADQAEEAPKLPEKAEFRVRITNHQALLKKLRQNNMSEEEAAKLAQLVDKTISEQKYAKDKVLSVKLEHKEWQSYLSLAKATLYFSTEKALDITPRADGNFDTALRKVKIERKISNIISPVRTSFLQAGQDAGLPRETLGELIKAFSYDVDFQRDVKPNDKLQVLYERMYTDDGTPIKSGGIIYAAFIQRGETVELYRFKQDDGTYGYFREDGTSVKRSMLRTPMDGARISSGFGMRTHPILGYSKMHRGVDFSAPTGTPILAAGDGTVDMASRNGGYGNYVRINHGSGYSSAYGHMSKFAKGIARGAKVRQGQVIGYVGSTGLSTGPHLHYEILANNVQVNPAQARFLASDRLSGKALAAFKRQRQEASNLISSLPKATQVASR